MKPNKSWKTTAAGLGAIFGALATIANAVSSGDYSNLPAALAALSAGVGLLAARDNKVTSEQAGAK